MTLRALQVSVLGRLLYKRIEHTRILMGLYDGTGTVEGVQWLDDNASEVCILRRVCMHWHCCSERNMRHWAVCP